MTVWISLILVFGAYYLLQLLYKKYWNKNLDIEIFLPSERLHEGDTSSIKEVITNDKFLPLPILEIFFNLDKGIVYDDMANSVLSDNLYRRDVFTVGGKKKISRTFDITCKKRGYYTLEKVEIMSNNLFMNDKFLDKKKLFEDFYVYPKRVKNEQIALPYKKIMGEMLAKKTLYEDPFSFGGNRNYTITDPMNKINWKATAKSQELIVNIYDSSINQKVFIFLDTYENVTFFSSDLNEESIAITSALIERMCRQGIEVNVQGNGKDVITEEILSLNATKRLNIDNMKQSLSRLTMGDEIPIDNYFDDVLKNHKDNFVVIVSKNEKLINSIQEKFEEFLWIIPYKGQKPEFLQFPQIKGKYIPWEFNALNIKSDS